jgi:hypothetical protein
MKPEEKAKELFGDFEPLVFNPEDSVNACDSKTKQCALICVDEILKWYKSDEMIQDFFNGESPSEKYWSEVKQEIEKL